MMFKIIGETMLEVHESQRWFIHTCLSLIDTFCVKMMRKFE